MSSSPLLLNLLPYRPAPTGLSRYVERLLSGWADSCAADQPLQLQVSASGQAELSRTLTLPRGQQSRSMRWLQSNALVQHAVPVRRLVALANPSLIYSPYTDRLLAVPDRQQVITCHDLTPLYWPSSRRAHWRSRLWLPRHLHGANRVVAISQHVADLLVEQGVTAERVVVITNGVEAVRNPLHSPKSLDLLLLARHARNKNISLALAGFAQLLRRRPQWPGSLIVVGGNGRDSPRLRRMEQDLGLRGRIRWQPHLPQPELDTLMRESFCLLATSLMEGFDYPLLEAQALGLPTLASRIPVHEELHRDVALMLELNDGGVSLAESVLRLERETDLWQQLSHRGLRNAQMHSLKRQILSLKQLLHALI